MTDQGPTDFGTTPVFEVRVTRDGEVVHTERCQTLEEAATVVDGWSGTDGVSTEIVDLLHGTREDEDLFEEMLLEDADLPE